MSGGGGGTISTSEPRLGALRVQQSSYEYILNYFKVYTYLAIYSGNIL